MFGRVGEHNGQDTEKKLIDSVCVFTVSPLYYLRGILVLTVP